MSLTNQAIYLSATIVLLVAGAVIFIMAFFANQLELMVTFILIGICFVILSALPLAFARRERSEQQRHTELMARLDEIKESLEEYKEQQGKSGVAIADIINSGMKLYSDYLKKDTDEEKDDEKG